MASFNLTRLYSALAASTLSLLTVGAPATAHATLASLGVDLGTAGPSNYAVLQIGMGGVDIEINAGGPINGISGNVGVNGLGDLKLTGGTFITGNVVLGDSSGVVLSGGATVGGTVTQNQAALTQARTDALNAAAAASALPSSGGGIGITSLTGPATLTPGVFNITTLDLSGSEKLTLTAGGAYVFNISNTFKINGNSSKAGVFLAAGLSEADVLFNYTGTSDIAFTGGGAGDNSILHGIILSPNAKVSLSPGTVYGEIISGKKISIVSGSDVAGTPIPEPTTALFGAALVGVAGFSRRRRRASESA